MDLHQTIFEVIDMRSFSNLWYWIGLAVMWSTASHWVLGVPWDMAIRARRKGGRLEEDFEALVRIYTARLVHIAEVSGLMLTSLIPFLLTVLGVLGFYYRIEFAQAVFLMAFPMTLVWILSIRTAQKVRAADETGEELHRRLARHRISVQAIGIVSIFFTAMWGMLQNFSIGVLG
ncbi:hypothetical protein [Pseudooceanicola nanhaiensis]|uniref:Component of SufBCD complex n=1 Tax=Pseudooceanicola nanhaiensis TaxID=375761 RepID=A0A917WBV7_9RHOB|nr:hypothetical protein [Pseudooceanicola nanhaiensis]GGL88200.1 hypothetical protein GCM10011534_07770 [Pseudooceanicola nanhaiensis]